jgi:Resolvase, N terminal domain
MPSRVSGGTQPPSEDPHARLLIQIQGAIAEYERMKIAERYRRGKLFRARQGEVIFWKVPYGYRRIPRRDGGASARGNRRVRSPGRSTRAPARACGGGPNWPWPLPVPLVEREDGGAGGVPVPGSVFRASFRSGSIARST